VERRALLARDDRFRSKLLASVAASGGKLMILQMPVLGKGIGLCKSMVTQQMNIDHAFVWPARYPANLQKLYELPIVIIVCMPYDVDGHL